MNLTTSNKRTNLDSHRQSIQQTEPINKYFDQSTRKNQMVDKIEVKLKHDNLFYKTYLSDEQFPKIFQFGSVDLVDRQNENKFRVFSDRDLCIQTKYQKKINQQIFMAMDEDCQTEQSQIEHAMKQNRLDVMKAVYVRERNIGTSQCATDIERSLFGSKLDYNYHSQQPFHESIAHKIVYYSQARNEMESEDIFN